MAEPAARAAMWNLRDMAQLRRMVRTGALPSIVALRLGRTESSVQFKIRQIDNAAPVRRLAGSCSAGGTSPRPKI